jgi:hypothetical protein
MSRQQWEEAYRQAWETYYTLEHIETILRRATVTNISRSKLLFLISWFKGCINIEKVHPLEGGFLRRKYRRDRRPGLPLEPVWSFYPRHWLGTLWNQLRWISLYLRLRMIHYKIGRDPQRHLYMDLALEPVADDELETREMFQTEAAAAYVGQQQRKLEIVSPKAA